MIEKIVVPVLGESITEATVSKWLKKEGDNVEVDEPIVELETDKVNLEVPSPISGVLTEISSKDGSVVEVGALLGSVSENIKQAVTDAKSGQVEIRNDKDGNIGVSIGKKSFSDDQLLKNYNAIIDALEKEKSNNTLKGDLIKGVFATSTMGVSYKLKLGKNI